MERYQVLRNTSTIIEVDAGGYDRFDKPVEVNIDICKLPPGISIDALKVVELRDGAVVDQNVPFQIDPYINLSGQEGIPGQSVGKYTLLILMKGVTKANETRTFAICPDSCKAEAKDSCFENKVHAYDGVIYEGQQSFRIDAENAVYYYHKQGAGFAAMIDAEGNDWISYRPEGGAHGHYRGIPNLAHPESQMHPGPGKPGDKSVILNNGPLKVTIYSETSDGKWACTWDIYPKYAVLSVLRTAHPYWFLYEGTPAGKLDEQTNYYVFSDRTKRYAHEPFTHPLPTPKWLYFGDDKVQRVLYLFMQGQEEVVDSYFPMEGGMTVFGFGRDRLEKYLAQTPATFMIGFSEKSSYDQVKKIIDSNYREVTISATPATG